ncbi:MAG: hypothetical protein OJF52_002266 [Nitrospira sp.]|jgi:hypothetical protein|nr:MAG: hypothetical protein OJF52_002266 [Nitrospira sp.]
MSMPGFTAVDSLPRTNDQYWLVSTHSLLYVGHAVGPQMRPQRPCTFTCTLEGGITVCRGNGPQCNGKSPWD